MTRTVAAYTLGCKVNQYDTEAVLEQFAARGWQVVDFSALADVYLINTCTVTGLSDKKSRQMIRRAKHLNPSAALIVTGCYAQTSPEELLAIPEVDLVIGGDRRSHIAELTEAYLADRVRRSFVGDISAVRDFDDLSVTHYENRTRAIMKVQEGCNQFCSYCIIPYSRGRIRSRSIESAREEARRLAQHGFCEIVLVGIHLASYGRENKTASLLDLIRAIAEIDGIRRIRLGSLEPTLFTEEFTEAISAIPKLCRHFHLSLQSGCDATLARMNRKYTTAQYAAVLSRIRSRMPDAAITTDIMVGFPQESEEEFVQTCRFVLEIRLADAHIFRYSARKGTPAAAMPGQIDAQEKERRAQRLSAITEKTRRDFLRSFLGREMEVLFEQRFGQSDTLFEGKTDNYITVAVSGGAELAGTLRRVRLTEEKNGILFGALVEQEENHEKQ